MKSDNVLGLIDDYRTEKPKYHQKIRKYLDKKHDFLNDRYGNLMAYEDRSKGTDLYEYFSSYARRKESRILADLSRYDRIDALAGDYYRRGIDEKAFIKPYIIKRFTSNIDEYTYQETKDLYTAFKNTDLALTFKPYYEQKRIEYRPILESLLEDYCKNEARLYDMHYQAGKSGVEGVVANSTALLIENAVNDGAINLNALDNLSYINAEQNINNVVRTEEANLISDINDCRDYLLAQLLGSNAYFVHNHLDKTRHLSASTFTVNPPNTVVRNILAVENREASSHDLLSIIPGIGDLVSLYDMYKMTQFEKKKAAALVYYYRQLADYYKKAFSKVFNSKYDAKFKDIRKNFLDSQTGLKNTIYENY